MKYPHLRAIPLTLLLSLGCGSDSSNPGTGTPGGDAGATTACPVVGPVDCGGDPVGLWTTLDWCPEDEAARAALCEHPGDTLAECAGDGNTALCDTRTMGSLELRADGSFVLIRTSSTNLTYSFDSQCLEAVSRVGSVGPTCASTDRLSCAAEGELCVCTASLNEGDINDVPNEPAEGTYEIDGSTLRFSVGGEVRFTATFCVTGDRLLMDVEPHEISWRYWVHQRS